MKQSFDRKLNLVNATHGAVVSAAALPRAGCWVSNASAGMVASLFLLVIALTPGMNSSDQSVQTSFACTELDRCYTCEPVDDSGMLGQLHVDVMCSLCQSAPTLFHA